MSQLLSSPRESDTYVVYLPGIEGSAALGAPLLSNARDLFPITPLHYPGLAKPTLDELADGCVHALRERGRQSAVWLGDSFGSAVALKIALRHPSATRGLVLAGGFTKCPNPFRVLCAAYAWDWAPEKWRNRSLRKKIGRLVRRNPGRFSPSAVEGFMSNGQFEFLSWRLRLLAAFDCRDEIEKLAGIPLLYLGGEEDSLVNTQEEARVLREIHPQARAFLFPNCGHAVLGERAVECLELLESFVPLTKRVAA